MNWWWRPLPQRPVRSAIMREEMQSAAELEVPLTVDIGSGSNWYEAHEL